MKAVSFAGSAACGLLLVSALAASVVHSRTAPSDSSRRPSIDGTFELTERVMADGTVLRPPAIFGLYSSVDGRFSLNLFVKQGNGSVASESSVGRYSFTADRYCEWIIYTVRKDIDQPGITNEAPPVTDHCASVSAKDGRFNFSPPGEGVEVSYGREGFTAKINGEFVDRWTKIR